MTDDINVSIDAADNVNVSVSPFDSIQVSITETSFGSLQTSDTDTIDLTFSNNTLSASFVPTADVSMASHKITNVADPSSAQDAATKAYVDSQVTTENLWDRTSTTLSPHTSGDNVTTSGVISTTNTTDSTSNTTGALLVSGGVGIAKNLVVDTSTLYVNTTTDKVGIGTASPATLLDVYSNSGSANPTIRVGSGSSASFPLFQLSDGRAGGSEWNIEGGRTLGNLSFYSSSNSGVGTVMSLKTSGNVGIGTTSPITKLEVSSGPSDGITITSSTSSPWMTLKTTTANTTSGGLRWTKSDDSFVVGILSHNGVADNNIEFYTSGAQKMTIDSAGNVGIGTTSPDSLRKLHIAGTGNTAAVKFQDTTDSSSFYLGVFNAYGGGNFAIDEDGVANRFVIQKATGNVGIGTSNPTQLLSVNGNVEIKGNSGNRYIITNETNTGTTKLTMQAGAGSSGFGGAINLYGHANATNPGWVTVGISASAGTVGTASEGRFTVNTQALGGGTDIFTVLRSGNVGIGTTSPVDKLHVVLNSNSSLVSRSEDSVRIGRIAAGRPALILDTSDTTYTNRSWYMENRGSVGSLVTGRNGLDVLTLGNSGSVGIGTASPNSNTKLNVIGGISSEKTAGGYYQEMNYSGNNPYLGFYAPTGYTIGYSTNIGTAPTSGITILNGGNVGIGTTSPSVKLEIAGITKITDTTSSTSTTTGALVVSGGLGAAKEIRAGGLIFPQQATTAGAPHMYLGAIYFDTTLNKLRVGGEAGWETITSV